MRRCQLDSDKKALFCVHLLCVRTEGERAIESAMTRNNTQQIQHRYVSNSKNFKAEIKLDESTPDSPSL